MIWSERDRDGRTTWTDAQGGRHDSPVTAALWNEEFGRQARAFQATATVQAPAGTRRPTSRWTAADHRAFWPRFAGLGCALWFAIGWFRRTDMSFVFSRFGRELGGDLATGALVVASIAIYALVRRLGLRVFDLFTRR